MESDHLSVTKRRSLLEELCDKVFKYIEKLRAECIEGTHDT